MSYEAKVNNNHHQHVVILINHPQSHYPNQYPQLEPGDHILSVNGEDVKEAPRDHVIQLVRACESKVTLVVCQPTMGTMGRKSTFLSAGKKAKLRTRPSRVRFAESVCVNGAPLFPVSVVRVWVGRSIY